MNSSFGYTGKVTFKTVYKDRVLCTQHFNSGTDTLFRAYSLALAGKNIDAYLPTHINIGYEEDGVFTSILRNSKGASIVRSFVESNDENPCYTRITISLTSGMFDGSKRADTKPLQIRLIANGSSVISDFGVLAKVSLNAEESTEFIDTAFSTPAGTQLIIVWDLYITNQEES